MNQKGFINIILVVVIVAIVAVVGYFTLVKKSPSTPDRQQIVNNTPPPSAGSKTPKGNPPPATQKKLTIHCNSGKTLPASSGGNVQSPLSVSLSLASPCPLTDGTIDGKISTSLYVNSAYPIDVKTISVVLSAEGNITITSPKTYSINNFALTTKDIKLLITGPGMGTLTVRASGIQNNGRRNEGVGSRDDIFFLLADDGDFIVSRSSYFELERAKLTNDLESGVINKLRYDQETQKMLEGKHTYICSQITCY